MHDYIAAFADHHRLSLSQLSVLLGYRSRTSLVRIMDQRVRPASVHDFASRLRQHFDLSETEQTALDRAVEIKLYGEASYLADRALWMLLRQETPEQTSGEIRVRDAVTGEPFDLREHFRPASRLRVTILNAEDAPVMAWVNRILTRPDATVRQYLRGSMGLTEMLNLLRTVSRAITAPAYDIYIRQPDEVYHVPRRGSIVICDYFLDGQPRESLIFFKSQSEATILERESNGIFQRLVASDLENYRPLKDNGTRNQQTQANYPAYLENCYRQEKGREVLSIKSVPRYNTIPPRVLGESITDVIPAKVRKAVVAIQEERVNNLFTCRKDIYTVLRLSAMRRLAETGRMPDHCWAMRAFTQAELAEWFRLLLDIHRRNPAFHLLFLRDEQLVGEMEFTWVGGQGLILIPQCANYDIGGSHVETLIYHEEMMSAYRDFFMTEIVRASCLSEAESLALLEELAAACERRAQKGESAT